MKLIIRFIAFFLIVAFVFFAGIKTVKAQVPNAPTYTGLLNEKVFLPAVVSGKNYKVSVTRFAAGGSETIGSFGYITTTGSITELSLMPGSNSKYGQIIIVNNTGVTATGVEINLGYAISYTNNSVAVISPGNSVTSDLMRAGTASFCNGAASFFKVTIASIPHNGLDPYIINYVANGN